MSVLKYRLHRLKLYLLPFLVVSALLVLGVLATYRMPVEGIPQGIEAWRLSNPSFARFLGIQAAVKHTDYFISLLFTFTLPFINLVFIRLCVVRLYSQMMQRQEIRFFVVPEKRLANIVFSVFVAIGFSLLIQHVLIFGLYRLAPLVFEQWKIGTESIFSIILRSWLFSLLPTGLYLFAAVFSFSGRISRTMDLLFILWALIAGLSKLEGTAKILKYFTPFSLYSIKGGTAFSNPLLLPALAATFGVMFALLSSLAFERKDFYGW